MAASIAAARACARTLLFESLRVDAFGGAAAHVLLVVDPVPCVQQKVLVEGYRQALEDFNGTLPTDAVDRAAGGDLFIPLNPSAEAPSGSGGLSCDGLATSASGARSISYSITPFRADTFMADVKRLQSLLRLCGEPATAREDGDGLCDSASNFERRLEQVAPYLWPLPTQPGGTTAPATADSVRHFCAGMRGGCRRELLGVILIQRNAFQNELRQYRLRLALFNLGLRVAEHCHLESMSVRADQLAAASQPALALADDQVYTYARSCALSPTTAVLLAKAIADSIDLQAWRRVKQQESAETSSEASDAAAAPPVLASCLENRQFTELFAAGSVTWSGAAYPPASLSREAYDAAVQRSIAGVGAPLRIVSRNGSDILTFGGGLEDCLMNTGHYAAADAPERNDVHAHRRRFPDVAEEGEEGSDRAEDTESGAAPGPMAAADGAGSGGASSTGAEVHGRLRKKEYLALLRARGEKPNKPAKKHAREAALNDSDADERTENARPRGEAVGGSPLPEGKGMGTSIGGTFPIGEVISESFDLSKLSGTCRVFAYPDMHKLVTMSRPEPFTMTIEEGCVTALSDGAPREFADLVSLVRQAEGGRCYVRELGIGLNPFTNPRHVLADVTSFERQWGIHLSLGQRHPLFVKQKARRNADGTIAEAVHVDGPVLKRKAGKYHIDVFVDAARLEIGDLAVDFTKGVLTA